MADENESPAPEEKPEAAANPAPEDSAPQPEPASAAAATHEAEAAPAAEKPAEAPKAEEPAKAAEPAKASKATAAAPAEESAKKPDALSLNPEIEKPKIVRAKGSKNVHSGIAHVFSSFNNTTVTITDLNGNVLSWSSAGKMNFRGSRKSTAYAAQVVAQDACRQAMGHGLKEVEVRVKGPGAGRESAVRAMQAVGLEINIIKDVTPVPHNGCRPPKQRRV